MVMVSLSYINSTCNAREFSWNFHPTINSKILNQKKMIATLTYIKFHKESRNVKSTYIARIKLLLNSAAKVHDEVQKSVHFFNV